MPRITARRTFRWVLIPILMFVVILVSYSDPQRPLRPLPQAVPDEGIQVEPTTLPTVIPKRYAIAKKAAVPWGDEITTVEGISVTETARRGTHQPYVLVNTTDRVSNSTDEMTDVLAHVVTESTSPTKPTYKLIKVIDKKSKKLKDIIKAKDIELVTKGMIRVRNIDPKPDKDRRKTFKYTIGSSKTGTQVAKKVLRLLFNLTRPTSPEEGNEFYDYYEYDYYEYYNIDMDFITNPFFFNTDCNFEDDNCTWVFKPEWRNMTTYFQRVNGNELAKILQVDPEEYRDYFTDWKDSMSGSYLWSVLHPGGEPVYVWSDLYHYSKPSCTLVFRTKSINLSRGEYSVVVDTLDDNEIVVLEERGNNKNVWERWHVPIGGVRKPFRLYIEVNPAPSGKRISHVFIDDIQLLSCFREGPQDKECPPNTFKCSDSIKDFCFNSSYICDIHRDCISGKDEEQDCDKVPEYGRCTFERGWCGWQNNPRTQIEWIKTIGRGNRSRRYVGPMYDHTLQNMHGKMLLANMSRGKDFSDEAILDSSVFNPPPPFHSQEGPYKGLCRVRFYYFQYAVHPAALSLFLVEMTPKGEKSTQIWTTFGSKGDIWYREEAELPKNVYHRYYLRFFAQRGTGGHAFIGLDDISLSPQCFGLHVPNEARGSYNYSSILSFGDMGSKSIQAVHKEFQDQPVYVFTTCGARGRLGPKPADCFREYNNTNVNVTVMTTPSIDGYQKWIVPEDGYYVFIVSGASGGVGYDGKGVSLGSVVAGVIKLTKNQSVYFVIGQEGLNGCRKNYQFPEDPACRAAEPVKNETILSPFWLLRKIKILEYKNDAGGGGGGTFVFLWNKKRGKIPLFIAGGGGGLGGGFHKDEGIQHGRGLDHGLEGTAGTQAGDWTGGAGAGWTGANGTARDVTGYGATHGAFGGKACNQETKLFGTGGFGGGGGGCRTGGGGGGFQGGSAHGEKPDGEGGYSYIAAGINYRRVAPGNNLGPGRVMVLRGFKGCGCQFLCVSLDETRTHGVCICPEGAELQSDLVSCRHYADKSRVDDIENSINESKNANQFERLMSGAIGFLIVVILAAMCFYSCNQYGFVSQWYQKIRRRFWRSIDEERSRSSPLTAKVLMGRDIPSRLWPRGHPPPGVYINPSKRRLDKEAPPELPPKGTQPPIRFHFEPPPRIHARGLSPSSSLPSRERRGSKYLREKGYTTFGRVYENQEFLSSRRYSGYLESQFDLSDFEDSTTESLASEIQIIPIDPSDPQFHRREFSEIQGPITEDYAFQIIRVDPSEVQIHHSDYSDMDSPQIDFPQVELTMVDERPPRLRPRGLGPRVPVERRFSQISQCGLYENKDFLYKRFGIMFPQDRINQRNRIELVTEKILRETDLKIRKLREEERQDNQITTTYEIMGQFCSEKDLPELPRDEVELCEVIGKGAFGKVFTGYYKKREPGALEMPVAVKTLTKTCSTQEESDYFLEALIMSKFDHPNIVRLIGVCFDRHPRLIVLELLKGGDLRKFLREHRPTPRAKSPLTMIDLLRCALDVASGCVYLEQNRFIHRDIAARNCLLTRTGPGRVVKIADFGLARDCYRCDYYKKGGRTMLPVKWMPPEAFQDGIFSIKTDVWAYGVLLWEIFSLGFMPYQGLGNREVMNMVVEGGRMDPPENCPPPVYGLMLRCWMHDPAERPSFKVIRERIGYCLQDPEVIKTPFPPHSALPPPEEEPLMRPVNFDWDKFEAYCIPPRKKQSPGSVDGASTSQAILEAPSTSREDLNTPSSRASFVDSKLDRPRRSQEIELNDLCLEPDEIVVLETSFTNPESPSCLQSAPPQSIQIPDIPVKEEKFQQESAFLKSKPEDVSRANSPKKDTPLCSYFKDKLQQKKKALSFGGKIPEFTSRKLPRITDNVEVVAERTYVKPRKKAKHSEDHLYSPPVPEQFRGDEPLKSFEDQQMNHIGAEDNVEVSEYSTFREDIQAFIADKKYLNNDGDTDDDQYMEERENIPPRILPDNNSIASEEPGKPRFDVPLQTLASDKKIEGLPNGPSRRATPEERGKRPLDKVRVPYKKKSSHKNPEEDHLEHLETIDESNI